MTARTANARRRGIVAQALAYAAATGAAWLTIHLLGQQFSPLGNAAVADFVATGVVFGFSVALSNSSMYDPYWSVAPPLLWVYWLTTGPSSPRAWLTGALVLVWAVRLTWNFFRGWQGPQHEDWRYRNIRAQTGRAYWLVSFAGIHAMPTLMTFAGSVPLYVVTAYSGAPLGLWDALAALVTLAGIGCEWLADAQLHRYRRSGPAPDAFLRSGLWRYSRHPNYFGEILFWWGLYLFALAAGRTYWWSGLGAVLITLLFLGISIPMIDRRMRARRPGYRNYEAQVSALVPWFPGRANPGGRDEALHAEGG